MDAIIHMNGRVYSPSLGRMLSPDPVTQAPENGQNYNRYSYAFNNPLQFTDPSGFAAKDNGDATRCKGDGCGDDGGGNRGANNPSMEHTYTRAPRLTLTPGTTGTADIGSYFEANGFSGGALSGKPGDAVGSGGDVKEISEPVDVKEDKFDCSQEAGAACQTVVALDLSSCDCFTTGFIPHPGALKGLLKGEALKKLWGSGKTFFGPKGPVFGHPAFGAPKKGMLNQSGQFRIGWGKHNGGAQFRIAFRNSKIDIGRTIRAKDIEK